MKLVKLAIISFIFLFALVTTISLFIPSGIRISKAANFAPGYKDVLQPISDLSGWRDWHPALKDIPANEFEVLTDSIIKIRSTTISIKKKTGDEVIAEMSADKGRPIMSGFKLINHQAGDSTTLQCYMDFKLRWYPWEKFRSLFYENIYGIQMEQGLANLKGLAEAHRSSSN